MTFTALEAILMGALMSAVVAAIVRFRCVSPRACRDTHSQLLRQIDNTHNHMLNLIDKMNTSVDIQFRMLRAIVAHLDLPPKEKTAILNMGPTKRSSQ